MENKQKTGFVKAALLKWLGVTPEMKVKTDWSEYSGTSTSGQNVSVDKSLHLSAVWACVKVVSETISTLPLKIYERKPDGSKSVATDHPVYQILCRQPAIDLTPARFMQMIPASICLRGNSFSEKLFFKKELVGIRPLLPQYMNVGSDDAGRITYKYSDPVTKTEREIPRENIMHVRGFSLDAAVGLTPIQFGADIIGSALATNEAASNVFKNGLQNSGFITSSMPLNPEQRTALRSNLQQFMGSKNAGKVMLLEGGFDYKGITINPETAQLLESRSFSIEEICRWFGVPPVIIGHMEKQSSWASSIESLYTQFLITGLRPMLVNIEQEIGRCLLDNDDRYFAEFAVEGLLRADSNGRASFYKQALQDGWMNRNEVRAKENLPPIDGGDKFTIQLNMTTLDKVGQSEE
ncbi:phage portal protein [Gilliamella apicola]|uniref:phage portal protein n=1 Tax=Gilliamella apicola TaxID=1196095 RepID=UPI000A34E58E|nr:phage portal protein [Gilliamella apicola]OTP93211.1 phage portal protein [Gilliamella apicola]OTQ00183.1 phage portal protein [Gilliamella apicola]OTQ31698.1 phage portal protein [Gilliamella apicola]